VGYSLAFDLHFLSYPPYLVTFPTAPHTEVTAQGDIVYSEVVREGVHKLEAYVKEMATGGSLPTAVNIEKVQEDVLKLWNVVKLQPEISQEQKNRIKALYDGVVRSLRRGPTAETRRATPRTRRSSSQFLRPQMVVPTTLPDGKIPLLHLERKSAGSWACSPFSPALEKARLALKSSKVSFLVVPTSLSPHHITVV